MTPSHQNYLQNSQKKNKHSEQNNLISRYICALFERSQRKTESQNLTKMQEWSP